MAAKTLQDFTLGTPATIQTDDFVVGYDTATSGGERRWTVSTLGNAVSGVMKTQLQTDITTGVTNVSILSTSPIAAKAWVNFDGTLATPSSVGRSYNVSSITKTGTGRYTVNFTTSMANANYAATFGSIRANNTGNISGAVTENNLIARTSSSIPIVVTDSSFGVVDATYVSVAIFGN